MTIQAIKPGPKRTATSTGKPDQRQRDNKGTPGNTPSLKATKTRKKESLDSKKLYFIHDINELATIIKTNTIKDKNGKH